MGPLSTLNKQNVYWIQYTLVCKPAPNDVGDLLTHWFGHSYTWASSAKLDALANGEALRIKKPPSGNNEPTVINLNGGLV